MPQSAERILVIKLGALGDFVLATGPAKAIRQYHSGAHITLLTTAPYEKMAVACPYFDAVWIDSRPSLLRDPIGVWRLRERLRGGRFSRIYDLQTSDRSGFYFQLMGPGRRPEWSGVARGCSHPHKNPRRDDIHTLERQAEQLRDAGIAEVPAPDVDWLDGDLARFDLGSGDLVLLAPGGAAHRPEKRWPADSYSDLARRIAAAGLTPAIIGGASERDVAARIAAAVPEARDLTGRTDFGALAALARRAKYAVGNDTGPVHLIAVAGCATIALFSGASDPALTAPRGRAVAILRRERLADLPIGEVAASLALS